MSLSVEGVGILTPLSKALRSAMLIAKGLQPRHQNRRSSMRRSCIASSVLTDLFWLSRLRSFAQSSPLANAETD